MVLGATGSPCADPKNTASFVFSPVTPGDYLFSTAVKTLPPVAAPVPALQVTDVVDPPLPPVNDAARKEEGKSGGDGDGSSESGQGRLVVDVMRVMLLLIGLFCVIGC